MGYDVDNQRWWLQNALELGFKHQDDIVVLVSGEFGKTFTCTSGADVDGIIKAFSRES
tara:strand:- start:296 stop:469 length:174 start_codon:yes stop_codon:yes gene_type:complete